MADIVIGAHNSGTVQAASKDALSVGVAISRTPQFQQAVSDPRKRDEFVSAIKLRQERAIATNDRQMLDVLGGLLNMVKASPKTVESPDARLTGSRFDTNNIFTV